MKKSLLLLFLFCVTLVGYSQVKLDYSAKPKTEAKGYSAKGLSASSAQFLYMLRQTEASTNLAAKKNLHAKLQSQFGVLQGKVSATLTLAEDVTPEELSIYGVTINNSAGGIYTATIPVNRFAELATSGLCETIDMGEKMELHLDNARENLGISQIHAGMHLPHGYDGTGVVVGVIDQGFEFCHPSFYDTAGNIRVKRVWNQWDSVGTAPYSYNYGSEYTTEAEMLIAAKDITTQTHATHVSGIAAGCGAPSGHGTTYKGIAPNADLVFVSSPLEEAQVLDAIAYIHNYARSVGKPCVINMSFGSNMGPHDGTSDKERFITSYMEQNSDSLVLVASAGNNGSFNHHLEKQFSPTDTILTTQLKFGASEDLNAGVDIWSEKNFSCALSLVNSNTLVQEDFTGFFTTGTVNDTLIAVQLMADDGTFLQCQIDLSPKSPYNNRYHTQMIIKSEGATPSNRDVILTIRCDSISNLHAWCSNFEFTQHPSVAGTVTGDDNYTVTGFCTNTDAVISVGSYVTRLGYNTYDGAFHSGNSATFGDISFFSSRGPTADGRVKPDITAPGDMIIAPYSHYATEGTLAVVDTIMWNGIEEHYGSMRGTSMACPMVTGVVALWLQQNPSLGVDSVRAILHSTARNDRYTGNIATNPNNVWGYGKVNAFGGLPTDTDLYLLTACPEEDGSGSVSGGGVVTLGTHTLTAIPADNYVFAAWEDGSTDNPRTVYVTCDTFFIATFNQSSYEDCDTITDFPWTATFDDNFTCWERIDADGDGYNWSITSAAIVSLATGDDILSLDNWLISPAIDVNQQLKLKVRTKCYNSTGSQKFSILLSTSGSEMTDFTHTLSSYTFTAVKEKEFSALLDDFQGQTVRIALRHHNCTGSVALLMLYDFVIEVMQDTVSVSSYTAESTYTVATQGLQLNISGVEEGALSIYDIMGRLIDSSPIANGSYRLPTAGLYILCVDGLKPRKVMLVR
ncbi:MAG: S8 family serine peptidase [Bacteroidales bacterium]|nr:S8 family serine peptidase [Bacteroidales bacterium]